MVERLHAAIETLHRMPHPVVGRVHGAVAGFGLSLMNACDLVVASDDAYFASAYRQIGLTPDGGGSWSLPRLVGMRKAMEILLLGERFDAATALALGMVNRVVPANALDAATAAIVGALANGPAQRAAQHQAPRPRSDGSHAVRTVAGRGDELRRLRGDDRFRGRHHGLSRQATAPVRARLIRGIPALGTAPAARLTTVVIRESRSSAQRSLAVCRRDCRCRRRSGRCARRHRFPASARLRSTFDAIADVVVALWRRACALRRRFAEARCRAILGPRPVRAAPSPGPRGTLRQRPPVPGRPPEPRPARSALSPRRATPAVPPRGST